MWVVWRTRGGFCGAGQAGAAQPGPAEVLEHFAELYAVEKEAGRRLSAEARLALRQAKSVPVMAALKPGSLKSGNRSRLAVNCPKLRLCLGQ